MYHTVFISFWVSTIKFVRSFFVFLVRLTTIKTALRRNIFRFATSAQTRGSICDFCQTDFTETCGSINAAPAIEPPNIIFFFLASSSSLFWGMVLLYQNQTSNYQNHQKDHCQTYYTSIVKEYLYCWDSIFTSRLWYKKTNGDNRHRGACKIIEEGLFYRGCI